MPYKDLARKRDWNRRWRDTLAGQEARACENARRVDARKARKEEIEIEREEEIRLLGGEWSRELYATKSGPRDAGARRKIVGQIKSRLGCKACGEQRPAVLGYTGNLSQVVDRASSFVLMKLLASRELLCANCRRIQRPPLDEVKLELVRIKSSRGCKVCGMKNGLALDYHHRDAGQKVADVSSLAKTSLARALAEAEKCDVLCSNCHILEHEEKL